MKIPTFERETRLAGAYLPQPTIDKLKLIALSRGISQSELIRDWIVDHVLESDDVRDLILNIGSQILESWEKACLNQKFQLTFAQYLGQMRQDLERKKLNTNHIESILKKVSELRHGRNDAPQNQRSSQRT